MGKVEKSVLAEGVKEVRKIRGISQAELERLTGVTDATISNIESGARGGSTTSIDLLCSGLQVPVWVAAFMGLPFDSKDADIYEYVVQKYFPKEGAKK